MGIRKAITAVLVAAAVVTAAETSPVEYAQDENTPGGQPVIAGEDSIPDSLLHPRWPVQKTVASSYEDMDSVSADLETPPNIRAKAEYNDTIDRYVIGTRIGGTYIGAPVMMSPEEYLNWSFKRDMKRFFRSKNDELFKAGGKEKFDFTDMHFDLGPAEKIFGPGGVRIRTQGSAELKFGANLKSIDNPSLPIRHRKTTTMDFDEKINLNVNGKVGDKVNMNLNYNTDATFDFDAQNMKLKYDGKEDEIIKLVEGGNVSFPSNSSLIRGASSLFGLRTDLQFGKLKLQLVASQKKSSTKSVASQGGVQLTPFEIKAADYEENRHFFLSHFFREKYDAAMKTLPNLTTGVVVNRIEVWITNKTGTTSNTRDIIAMADLGENSAISNPLWTASGLQVPSNGANTEYSTLAGAYQGARAISQASTVLDGIQGFEGGRDYEKLERARLLNPSEYTLNAALGYISLKTAMQPDQVLAVAYEYTYGGQTYQVGEFAADIPETGSALFVKALKNTSGNPRQANWPLMMKNAYYLASSIEKDKFRLDVKFQSDTAGVYLSYMPEPQVKDRQILRLIGADRLDNNNKAHPNGYFDFIEGYTVSNGRVFFPSAEPFGRGMQKALTDAGVPAEKAAAYAFNELYDSTKTVAKQIAEKDKYLLMGQFRGTAANIISLGAYNVPQGSVVVTAGGVTLTEGSDYAVDYSAGEVTILNQSLLDAGTAVNVSLESNTDFAQERKTMLGMNWAYDFSKDFQLSGTLQRLTEQPLTTKVAMGNEPLSNTLWGFNVNWKKESQWLTNVLDKLPLLRLTKPSSISFTGEFAQLIAGQTHGTQDNASYIDDFENTKNTIDISSPTSWVMSSVPSMFPESSDKATLASGYNRSRLAWYSIDPLFTRRSSSLTPAHIKGDLEQLSDLYVREVYVRDIYPNRDRSSYNGSVSTLPILNLAYYPSERGPYNFDTNLNYDGTLTSPSKRWGGMMRKIDASDFEAANVEYIEFWLLDPFIYSNETPEASQYGGDFYINLGEVSEDILRDGKKYYESGMPIDGSAAYTETQWGRIPDQATVTYAFATSAGSRQRQDLGYNGLTDEEERSFPGYQDFLSTVQGKVSPAVFDSILNDPANDNYHYFRGSDYDREKASILRRYKYINNPQGNSPDTENRTETYDTSYKTTPDAEDINQDYTLNEYEKYYQYHVSLRPQDLVVGQNHIVDKRVSSTTLRNGNTATATWYQFRIPIDDYQSRHGGISDFTSVRFMRMFLTGFEKPVVLRFASLDLVRGEWRSYEQNIDAGAATGAGRMTVSAVNLEENNDKTPVNYILPPGIKRGQDPTQPQLVEDNEQALALDVEGLSPGESKAVYKNTTLDLRQYKRLQMFVHANADEPNQTSLSNGQLALFVRLGSDYKSNFYEYEIPLELTPADEYNRYSLEDARRVWPQANMLDIALDIFTAVKKNRNKDKAAGMASYNKLYSMYDENRPNNKVSVMGNPTLGEVKTMVIGVRNVSGETKSGEVWVNELRLLEHDSRGGWAAQGNLNLQLSDLGTVNMQGKFTSDGFGGLEDGVAQRATDDDAAYSVTTSVELGKLFPEKAKVTAPLYYSVTQETISPRYNPLDTDMRLADALEAAGAARERDSIESIAVTKTKATNFSLSNVRVGIANKKHPMPYDPANFSLSYSHSHKYSAGETTIYEKEDNWRGALDYNWTPVYKPWEPFKAAKSKSKWLDILKKFSLNWLPQSVGFNTEITRNYYELQERDMEDLGGSGLPLTFSQQFLWNRDFNIRWDLTKNLHASFQSATHAEVEEPYTPVNKDLYADRYSAWKDSVKTSLRSLGTPLDYNQAATLSYKLPLNLLPIFDWVNADAAYNATYSWQMGSEMEDGSTIGNTIANNRSLNINGTLNLEKLYNHVPFLKKANANAFKPKKKTEGGKAEKKKDKKDKKDKLDKELPRNKNSYEKMVTLSPDSALEITHNRKTRRIIVSAKAESGKAVKIRYKKEGVNKIRIYGLNDSAQKVKVMVTPMEPLDNKVWYKALQGASRLLMSLRNVSFSYRDQYSMSLPGFLPNIGDAFGQTNKTAAMAPGLDFAFGLTGDDYIEKARRNGWLLVSDSVATPAATTHTEDLQVKMTLEPLPDLKIDLNASRTMTMAKSVQYMYAGNPTTLNGTFTMTTLSLSSAFKGVGSQAGGFRNATFEKFCNSLETYRQRVEAQYAGAVYPSGTRLAGKAFSPEHGAVGKYSSDVMVPAFIAAYTDMGGGSLGIFPGIARILPNWTLKYSGLSKIPWVAGLFKSVNINHAYKSVYAVGAFSSYSTFMEYMGGLGFVSEATTGAPVPSSMYNVSAVSVNEAFSPLIGIDATLHNNLTAKLEYRSTRVTALSMTSVQINETTSNDWVVGASYKINNFNLFGPRRPAAKKTSGEEKPAARGGVNHDLNLRLDVSFRRQAAITRDIATMTSAATSGNSALKIGFTADYTLSRLLTMALYYDRQSNTPLMSSSTYPTVTQDFGLSLKFSLTR